MLCVFCAVLFVCTCACIYALASAQAICLSISLNRNSRDSPFHLSNFAETRCQTVAPVEKVSPACVSASLCPFPHPDTHPKLRVYVCVSIIQPSNIARGHIVKYGTHTKGIYPYNGNGYGYQKLLHINAYAYWVGMHVINFVSLHVSAAGNY